MFNSHSVGMSMIVSIGKTVFTGLLLGSFAGYGNFLWVDPGHLTW